ncbi:diadenylate cyclase [Peribacillus sp. NJ11]|uniref:diadenylate cyclase n=1 Tax=Peribacillus sp. NJ11 TaxID=3055861 RepID=UPI0025A28B25|nr:diadenylate cyclase [Peribacillus sp. NJ11]MDM5223548.1 diadenylate cyclase [Peribacillus sp. NJ11]
MEQQNNYRIHEDIEKLHKKTFIVLDLEEHFSDELQDNPFFVEFISEWQKSWFFSNYDEIGRRAAELCDNDLNLIINDVHIISSTTYENNDCHGCLLVGYEEPDIKFEEEIDIKEHKRVRKLLETTGKNLILLVNTRGKVRGYKYMENIKGIVGTIFIKFNGWFSWSCEVDGLHIFDFEKMCAKFPYNTDDGVSINKLKMAIEKYSSLEKETISEEIINSLTSIVKSVSKQKSGALLVILDEDFAKKEISRLRYSSTIISPQSINSSTIHDLSSIDGAVILDIKGNCHAFGTILDGIESKGDASRGLVLGNASLSSSNYPYASPA